MRVKIQIIAQLKYVHSSLLRSNIILKLACKTFPKEKSEITNFVSFAYGRCSFLEIFIFDKYHIAYLKNSEGIYLS